MNQLGDEARALIAASAMPVELINAPGALAWTRAGEAEVLFTAPRHGWKNAPEQAPAGWPGRLQWAHLASAGIDYFPSWLFEVPQVTCSRGVAAVPIAEYVLGALLDHQKSWTGLGVSSAAEWRQTFERVDRQPLGLLHGQTLGLVGYGAIGQAIARRALAFGMQVTALRRSAASLKEDGVRVAASLPELLAESHHVVLALPLTPQTRHLINAETLAHARPGLHLVNIARGPLIDQSALLQALDGGRLSRATLDVTDPEPLHDGHPLYRHPRVRLTPHISWSAGETAELTAGKFVDNLARYIGGQPLEDRVDLSRGY
ncbi:MAG: D-isomer specific 2-hydroxyacid dehydrogenase family protein [Polaromonas sp.]